MAAGAPAASDERRWPGVWRGGVLRRDQPGLPSGHALLDRHLPGGGWPLGALTELLTHTPGSGEFGLLLPALAAITRRGHWAVLVDPPWVPYPPALCGHGIALDHLLLIRSGNPRESLWACEQALRGTRGGVLLAWHEDPGFTRLRRLQLAARAGGQAAFLFRPARAAAQASPAALRLRLDGDEAGARVEILKCQGPRPEQPLRLRASPHLPGVAARGHAGREPPAPQRPPAAGPAAATLGAEPGHGAEPH